MRLTWINAPDVDKYATYKKMRHTWENAPNLKNAAHLKICVALKKMRHTWKNAPHSRKRGTLGKMPHT